MFPLVPRSLGGGARDNSNARSSIGSGPGRALGGRCRQSVSPPTTVSEVPGTTGAGPLRPAKVTAGEILQLTWDTLTNRTKDCLLLGLILIALYIAGNSVSFVLSTLLGVAGGAEQPVVAVTINLLLYLWGQVFGAVVMGVALRYLLNLLRGSPEPMRGAFHILPVLWRLILVQIAISLIAGVIAGGLALICMLPLMIFGFNGQQPPVFLIGWFLILVPIVFCLVMYIWIRLSLAPALVIDRNLGVIDSLSESLRYTRGNVLGIFGGLFVVGLLAGLFALVTCMLGSVLGLPAVMLSIAVAYLLATGQFDSSPAGSFVSESGNPFADPSGDDFGRPDQPDRAV